MPEADAAGQGSLSPGEFGTAFKAFLEQSTAQAPKAEPVLAARLRRHLGADPRGLAVLVANHHLVRLAHRRRNRFPVPRQQAAQIHDFDGDTLAGQRFPSFLDSLRALDRLDLPRRTLTVDRQLVTPVKAPPHFGPPKTSTDTMISVGMAIRIRRPM